MFVMRPPVAAWASALARDAAGAPASSSGVIQVMAARMMPASGSIHAGRPAWMVAATSGTPGR